MDNKYANMEGSTRAAHSQIYQQENEYKKRVELLEKAIDGTSRYNFEPLFRSVIEALANGIEPWHIIEKLLEMNMALADKCKKLIDQWPTGYHPPIF